MNFIESEDSNLKIYKTLRQIYLDRENSSMSKYDGDTISYLLEKGFVKLDDMYPLTLTADGFNEMLMYKNNNQEKLFEMMNNLMD